MRVLRKWLTTAGVPIAGRIGPRATIEGGDIVWLQPDLVCVGRSLRTNAAGARQLANILGSLKPKVEVRTFDLPYWRGPGELVHLLSVISPVTDELAVVYPPLLPIGLWDLLAELGIATIAVPDEEWPTLGPNVLAVRPGVVIMADGNPVTRRALEAAGCEVHTYPAAEIGLNGSGGPTCMALPVGRG
jgi:N-dimethylarginine dimethylaminohydrolase